MALAQFPGVNPFASPDPGSEWDLLAQLSQMPGATPAAIAPTPAATALPTQPPDQPAENWWQRIISPRPEPWAEALRTIGLNLPFSSRLLTGQPGVMTLGQVFKPAIEQHQNQRAWEAMEKFGAFKGTDVSGFKRSGIDPLKMLAIMRTRNNVIKLKEIPGYLDRVGKGMSDTQRAAMGEMSVSTSQAGQIMEDVARQSSMAASLRQEAERLGVPIDIPELVDPASATMFRQRISETSKERGLESRGQRIADEYRRAGIPVPQAMTDPTAINKFVGDYNSQQQQTRQFTFSQEQQARQFTQSWAQLAQTIGATNARFFEMERMRQESQDRDKVFQAEGQVINDLDGTIKNIRKEIAGVKTNYGIEDAQKAAITDELESQMRDLQAKKTRMQRLHLEGTKREPAATPPKGKSPAGKGEAAPAGQQPDLFERF